MYNPNKRLGDDEESGKKPGLMVALKFKPERRLGEEDDAEDGEPEPDSDLEAQAEEAARKICRIVNINSSKSSELKSLLETIFIAADAKPHSEGEHTDEEEN